MQLSDMRTRLRKRIGSPTLADVSDDDLTAHLNSSMLDIMDRFRFHKARQRCRFDTVMGVSRYNIPPDAKAIFRLMNVTRGYKLTKRGDRFLASNSSPTDNTVADDTNIPAPDKWSLPTDYIRYRDYMELMPIPDGIYTMEIFYKYDVSELSDDTDVPPIPASWHIGIVMFAEWYYYDEQKDVPKAQAALASFSQWNSSKPDEIDEESVDIDTGVEIPTLSQNVSSRLDFNHAD